mmetsp:Transcript_12838/g.37277  ORF Transcript_12838/g.37277 Transcript_12838/m.37277 type:complete len:270 (+) Transcript_12838:193-1002(+)
MHDDDSGDDDPHDGAEEAKVTSSLGPLVPCLFDGLVGHQHGFLFRRSEAADRRLLLLHLAFKIRDILAQLEDLGAGGFQVCFHRVLLLLGRLQSLLQLGDLLLGLGAACAASDHSEKPSSSGSAGGCDHGGLAFAETGHLLLELVDLSPELLFLFFGGLDDAFEFGDLVLVLELLIGKGCGSFSFALLPLGSDLVGEGGDLVLEFGDLGLEFLSVSGLFDAEGVGDELVGGDASLLEVLGLSAGLHVPGVDGVDLVGGVAHGGGDFSQG